MSQVIGWVVVGLVVTLALIALGTVLYFIANMLFIFGYALGGVV